MTYRLSARAREEARQYVQRIEKRIVLVDGKQLADLMIEHFGAREK